MEGAWLGWGQFKPSKWSHLEPSQPPNISRARDLIGWQAAVKLEKGLKRTVAWFAAQDVRLSQAGLTDG